MKLDTTILSRLTLIKYLYSLGVKQSYESEPFCAFSILYFHDSIEMFLQLVAEYLKAGKPKSFMDYWNIINQKLQGQSLGLKISMERLNRGRVNLKHHGIIPSKEAIDSFRVSVENFFIENLPIVFGINFSDVSLLELVENLEVKSRLEEATQLIEKGEITKVLEKVACAFDILIDEHKRTTKRYFGHPSLIPNELPSSIFGTWENEELTDFVSEVETFTNEMIFILAEILPVVKILSLGIDYQEYLKFSSIIPDLRMIGREKILKRKLRKPYGGSIADAKFCIDFVTKTSLKLQKH